MTNSFNMIASERGINLDLILKEHGKEATKVWLNSLTEEEMFYLSTDNFFNLREGQIIPSESGEGFWGTALFPGRSYGKSFALSSWVIRRACLGKGPIALVGETAASVRDVMIEVGDSSIMKLCPDRFMPEYVPSKRRLTFPNGVVCLTYAGVEPDSLRGPQHQSAACDELAKYDYAEDVMSNLSMGMRIGTPYTAVATTPRPIPIIKRMIEDPSWHVIRGSTFENLSIPDSFKEQMRKDYEGTALGRQELEGALLMEDENALWQRGFIEPYRVKCAPTSYHNIVIAVDPTTGGGSKRNDETGIVVACSQLVEGELHAYILEDATMKGTPKEWATKVAELLERYPEANILAESNAGGTMITEVLTKYGIPLFKVQLKHHMRSKYDRAMPVSLFAQKGMIHHCGMFEKLEDELCSYSGSSKEKSPNRLDALVIACHALLVKKRGKWKQGTF